MELVKLIAVVIISTLMYGCGETKTADTHIAKANEYKDAKQTNKGIIELKNAVRLEPAKGEARLLLGELYLSEGSAANAVKELEKAFDLKFTPDKVIPLLARAYMLVESSDDILALDEASKTLSDDSKVHYLAYKTFAALRTQQLTLAKKAVAQANELSPLSLYSMLANTYLQVHEKHIDAAAELVSKMLAINPKHPDVLMLQGQILTAKKNHLSASESYKQYLMVQPSAGVVQLLLADALLKAKVYDEAEKYADIILKAISTQPFANYIKAMVRFQAKDYAKASEHAELALQANFNKFNLKLVAGASAFHLKNYEQSNHHLSAIVNFLPPNNIARRMLALSQLQLGLIEDIATTVSGISTTTDENAKFITSISYKLLELGAVDEAKKLVDQAALGQTQNASQSAREGILKLMMNDASGVESLENALKINPDLLAAELALAFTEMQSGNIDKAKVLAEKWLIKYPDKPSGHNLMATIYTKQGELDNAWLSLQKSLQVLPDSVFALTESIKILYKQGKNEEAKRFTDTVLQSHGKNALVLRLYFDLYRDDKALAKIKRVFVKDKENMAVALVYVEALLSLSKANEAINVLSRFEPSNKTAKKYWHLSVIAQKQINAVNGVQLTLEKWRKVNPYHLEPVVLLADIFATKRDYHKALSVVKKGLDQHQDNLTLKMVKMQLLLSSQKIQSAKELYKELSTEKINEDLKAGMQGRILLLEKNYKDAIAKLIPFYNAYPSSRNAIYLAVAYQANQQVTFATSTLENHLLTNKKDDRVRAILANLYLQDETDKALQTYQLLVKTQPDNVLVNNNLAWLYMEKEDIDNALLYSKKAYLLAPKSPEVVDTYAQSLFKSGRKSIALEQSEKAYALSEGKSVDITLNYIKVLIANGLNKKATLLLVNTNAGSEGQKQIKQALQKMLQ